ncbi:RNA polymerase II-associated protein 1 [Fopius arisanus]|uniref:RNA polymerase II-associated protein 1 n=1 Tax=Fopius arisanus TaxID=64838 RepID=A0A9R1U0U9_9HYME|nr:PREDICTED: RNA polymerase II-associated protein 1 [Fopius arisanus]XP_011303503.1 PREDICTED: RNA polymerase II-associated protein 1 [Fopius arisanus]
MNDHTTLKRPKPEDDEEELFRMQEEFLQSHETPSAKVINLRSKNSHPRKFISKFAERRGKREKSKISTSHSSGDVINPSFNEEMTGDDLDPVENMSASKIILGNIIEKKFTAPCLKSPQIAESTGFPEVFLVAKIPETDPSSSLFHRNIQSSSSIGATAPNTEESKSLLVEGPLSSEIHKENLEKLNRMTQEEILQEKAHLESLLSPELIEFIKAKKSASQKFGNSLKTPVNPSASNPDSRIPCPAVDEIQEAVSPSPEVSNLLEEASTHQWLNMSTLESPKLEWMKDLEPDKCPQVSENEPYTARFSFEGELLPYNDPSISMDRGLHHHGEDPSRPGYSIPELLQLSRSSQQQQRCVALTTISKILDKTRNGWYDKALEPAPLIALNSKNILLLLRFSLDDSAVAVLTASLQALRSFLYSETEEFCLDRCFSWRCEVGGYLVPEMLPKVDEVDMSSLKDHELAQIDCVSAAVRSQILVRLSYILGFYTRKEKSPPEWSVAALEILTRISRHSRIIALNVASTPNLLSIIMKHFLPLEEDALPSRESLNSLTSPTVKALHLFRVLVEYGGRPVADRLQQLKIVDRLLCYTTQKSRMASLWLSIESFRLWKTLLDNGLPLETVNGNAYDLACQLRYVFSNHDISGSELSSELAAGLVGVSSYGEEFEPILIMLLEKWSTQLGTSNITWGNTKLIATTLACVKDSSSFKLDWINNPKIFRDIISSSNVLSGLQAASRDPEALPSLSAVLEEGKVVPVLSSCFHFYSTVINHFSKHCMLDELKAILNNPDVMEYLKRANSCSWSLVNNWFTRLELYFLAGVVEASQNVSTELPPEVYRRIAIKLLPAIPGDCPELAKSVLKMLLSDNRLNIAGLSQGMTSLKLEDTGKNSCLLDNVSVIYDEFISPGSWNQPVLPRDWVYLPLVASYTRHKEESKWTEEDTLRIVILLTLEVTLPELFVDLSPTLRFSRLVLIYLCDTLHLDENVKILLQKMIPKFLKEFHKCLNFSSDIPGVNSFPDLFTALCEGFCANSYGDDGFAMVLMAPIAQRHDKYYRKILWSEHAGALRYIRLRPEALPFPVDEYLFPEEEDCSLIEGYITALVRGTVKKEFSPLMYLIALQHSVAFLQGESDLSRKMRERIHLVNDKELVEKLLGET